MINFYIRRKQVKFLAKKKFVMFYFLFFQKTGNNRLKKKPVGQNFVIFFCFLA